LRASREGGCSYMTVSIGRGLSSLCNRDTGFGSNFVSIGAISFPRRRAGPRWVTDIIGVSSIVDKRLDSTDLWHGR
jgi:hypothetical protein